MEPKAPVVLSQLQFEKDRRAKLAEVLSKGADRQVGSHLDGIAKVLQMGMAGYQTGKADKLDKELKQRKADIISGVVSGQTPREEAMGQLSQLPEYQETVVKAAIEKPKFEGLKEEAEKALLSQTMGQPLTAEGEAAIKAYDRLRQTELMYDPRQNIVPKYGSLMASQAPAMSATPTAQGNPQPVAGEMLPPPNLGNGEMLMPPPATKAEMGPRSGAPMPLSAIPAPPAGLDARAQGQYMDALASQSAQMAAERANNNGLPKMTETQQQAASRSNLINSGLRQISDVMMSDNLSAPRMAFAETVEGLGPIGSVMGNAIRTPDEQRMIAGRDAAIEGFASAVTGAGVTQDQFTRFSRLLPQGSENEDVRREKLANAYEFLLTQTQIAGPIANDIQAEVMRLREMRGTPPVAPQTGTKRLRFNPTTGELE